MSRSGYSDGLEPWALIRWRGAVASALRGKRGQAFLRELLRAMDSLPRHRLIANYLEDDGEVCALGSVGIARGLELSDFDLEDSEALAEAFGIAEAMVKEIEFENDEGTWRSETPEARFQRMRQWAQSHLLDD